MVGSKKRGESPFAERDPALGEVVGGEFDLHFVARNDTDEIFPHLAGNVGVDDVPTGDLHPEAGVGEGLRDDPLHFKSLFFFGHGFPDLNGAAGRLPHGLPGFKPGMYPAPAGRSSTDRQ